MTDFPTLQRTRIAEQIATAVRDAILGGAYRPGDALPAERDLAERFGVNRGSVREAMHRLDAWGLVEVRHGGGTRVLDFLATAGMQALPWLLAPGGTLDPRMLRDLLELRVALLGFTAELAARRASETDVAELRSMLDELSTLRDAAEVQEREFVFWERLVEATDNRVLRLLAGSIGRIYLQRRDLFAGLYPEGPPDLTLPRQMLDAVEARDPVRARAALEAWGRSMLPGGMEEVR